MKTLLNTLIILLIGVSFSSCDDIEDLADIKFNSSLGTDITVDVPAPGAMKATIKTGGYSFSESEIIDPQSDSNIKKYLDKLKSFDVQKITGTFKKVTTPIIIESGTITISQGSKSAFWLIEDFEVVNGAKITLDSGEGQWATVNQILKTTNKFTAKIEGNASRYDERFTIYILIEVKVVANPL